jgi:Ser/Thr protein kinase RdoA (MazF antagonist)
VLFDGPEGRVVALLDLDLVRVAERARDVAIAMLKHARVYGRRTERGHDAGTPLSERAIAFVETYHHLEPLTAAERRAIPFLAFDEARRRVLYILGRHYDEGDDSSDFDLSKQVAQMEEALRLHEEEALRPHEEEALRLRDVLPGGSEA